jgi:DNA-binding beta-propeller fold protein YncE
MKTGAKIFSLVMVLAVGFLACAGGGEGLRSALDLGEPREVLASYQGMKGASLGEPLGVTVDFQGDLFVADGVPGRIVGFDKTGSSGFEFQDPSAGPGFYPTDIKLKGFFIYAVDEVNRNILRFDKQGAYRDILLSLSGEIAGRRASPYALDVDESGRMAITDVENHRVLVFDVYLSLELAFGGYGSYPGQFDTPEGIAFAPDGRLIVADSGNRRVQIFDSGGRLLRTVPKSGAPNPMSRPRRAVLGPAGRVFVADPDAGVVFIFSGEGDLLRAVYPKGAEKFHPMDVEISREGRLYVADTAGRRVLVFKVMAY